MAFLYRMFGWGASTPPAPPQSSENQDDSKPVSTEPTAREIKAPNTSDDSNEKAKRALELSSKNFEDDLIKLKNEELMKQGMMLFGTTEGEPAFGKIVFGLADLPIGTGFKTEKGTLVRRISYFEVTVSTAAPPAASGKGLSLASHKEEILAIPKEIAKNKEEEQKKQIKTSEIEAKEMKEIEKRQVEKLKDTPRKSPAHSPIETEHKKEADHHSKESEKQKEDETTQRNLQVFQKGHRRMPSKTLREQVEKIKQKALDENKHDQERDRKDDEEHRQRQEELEKERKAEEKRIEDAKKAEQKRLQQIKEDEAKKAEEKKRNEEQKK
eukprot:TRINITY_DN1350_c0_g1_i1.p1 TRINITY_DN1350_c0_g1~~TRINITY_DN1350_c0_g1_i1.p1  ORF type:complete len:326 (-),score=127.16 TRINITY_DN1350_c0_g1_i1:1454-2431(-)